MKTAHFGGFSLSSTISMWDKNIDAFPFSERSVGHQIAASHWHFCTVNGRSGETPLLPSKAPKTHPNNLQHTHTMCCDLRINHAIDTLLLWEQVPKNCFSRHSDTASRLQRHRCDQSDHPVVNVAVTTWSQHVHGACWRLSESVLEALDAGNNVSPLLPLNVQNCQREAAIWWPTEHPEKVKASTFLSYKGIVDDRLISTKSAVFL